MVKIKNGFSLVELIVVMAIMAVLAAVVTPITMRYVRMAEDAKSKNEAQGLLNLGMNFLIEEAAVQDNKVFADSFNKYVQNNAAELKDRIIFEGDLTQKENQDKYLIRLDIDTLTMYVDYYGKADKKIITEYKVLVISDDSKD